MKNNKSSVLKILISFVCFCVLAVPFQSAEAFWPFKKKSAPSAELTLILDAARKSLVEEMGGTLREGGICEAAVLELALDKLIELTRQDLLEAAKKTFLDIEKTLLAGAAKIGGEAWDIIVAMGKKAAQLEFSEKMDEKKNKENNEKLVFNGKTNTGCDYKMSVEWLKKEKTVHVFMSGDCHCKEQITTPIGGKETRKPLSKFKIEFDIDYYYEILEYEIDGKTKEVLGYAGGIRTKAGSFKHPFENISEIWYEGMGEDEKWCGCKDSESVKKVSAGPGFIKPDSALAFVDTTMEKVGMFFALGHQKKVEKALVYADEKLAEIAVMADAGDFFAMKKAGDKYEYFIKTASRESEKIKGKQKDNAKTSIKDDLLVDEEIIEEIISQNSTKNDEIEKEELRKIMKEILTTVNRLFAPPKKEVTGEVKKEEPVKKEEVNKGLKKAEPKKAIEKIELKPKTIVPPPKPVQKPIEEAPQEQDVCGDGKITGVEICDGNLFSKMCSDAIAEYKAGMGNPNLAPRCFNNCRGCEASAPGH